MFKINNPIEQFENIKVACSWVLMQHNFVITMLIIVSLIAWLLFLNINILLDNSENLTINYISPLLDKLYSFIANILIVNISILRERVLLISLTWLFIFILLSNLIGLIPYSYTLTASLLVPFFVCTSGYIAIHFVGFYGNALSFFNFFIPTGVPSFLLPFLAIIEMISHWIKCISLSVRLFANMFAGHVLLLILGTSTFLMLTIPALILLGIIGPYILLSLIYGLEMTVGAIQAYVLITLIIIYFGDIININSH